MILGFCLLIYKKGSYSAIQAKPVAQSLAASPAQDSPAISL